jgi:hypothetical protein
MRRSLPEYRMFAIQRGGDSSTAPEMAPILFRRSAFEVIQSGFFWLSPTPDVAGSKSRASAFPAHRHLGRAAPQGIRASPGLSQHPLRLPTPRHQRLGAPIAKMGDWRAAALSAHRLRRFQRRQAIHRLPPADRPARGRLPPSPPARPKRSHLPRLWPRGAAHHD